MLKVLLVDDDNEQLTLRRMLLEHHGFEPACADNPESALTLAHENQPDIAVVDLGLPTEDQGWQLISQLKQTVPEVSIIVLSGASPSHGSARPEGELVNAWVTKGGGARALIDTLQRLAA